MAKAATDIPIIGSLNGVSAGGWIDYARKIQEVGADAIELNVYYIPADGRFGCEDSIEQIYIDDLKLIKANVNIPVAMKLSSSFSSMSHMAARLDAAGADALLFNRFYQPEPRSAEAGSRSLPAPGARPMKLRLPLRWIAILYGHVKASLAATTGIHEADDALKAIMAGADVAECRIGAAGARRRGHHRSGERRQPVDGGARVRIDQLR